jgi:trans-2,3-dihydro-3-hydroxyanthranilate isomerase
MQSLPFYTVDVFTERRFGGNPLAVVFGSEQIDVSQMQAIAAEFNLSETTFVLPPDDPRNTARIRIFNRTAEMPFAGHPMVGTAFVLATLRDELRAATFEIPAGNVTVEIERSANNEPISVSIDAPQPLSLGEEVSPALVAGALRLSLADIVVTHHAPLIASNGNSFVIAELTESALARCNPDLDAFAAARAATPAMGSRFALHVYVRDGSKLRARMFAPLAGTLEDPATGSANAPLACLLLSLDPEVHEAEFVIHQGVEMGRPSILNLSAKRSSEGIVATLRGSCVSVMRGEITL